MKGIHCALQGRLGQDLEIWPRHTAAMRGGEFWRTVALLDEEKA